MSYFLDDEVKFTQGIRFSLLSQEEVLSLSKGEVKYPETMHYRTRKAIPGGLFCYKIFGGGKRDACECGKYEGEKFRGLVCSVCGVAVVSEMEKRSFFGHVNLALPLVNWRILTSKTVRYLIGLNNVQLNNLMNFRRFLEVQPDKSYKLIPTWHSDKKVLVGGEAIEYVIDSLPPLEPKIQKGLITILRKGEFGSVQWDLVWSGYRFLRCGNSLKDLILKNLLVLPVSQRPIIFSDSGTYVSSQINQVYLYLISTNNRLKKMRVSKALDLVVYPAYALLQKICNNLLWVPETNKVQVKAIANYIKGKQGVIRQHLLASRINLSARAVIHADPSVPYGFCTIPYTILRDIFLNHAQNYLVENGYCEDQYAALNFWLNEGLDPELMRDVINRLSLKIPIYVNRNPTLHALSIQCIYAIPTEGTSIGLHPNMCKAMGGDFDGDTVQVNGLLHRDTILEARDKMLFKSVYNTSDGSLTLKPMKEIALGCYVLTNDPLKEKEASVMECVSLLEVNSLLEFYHYRTPVKMFWKDGLIDTTLGRMKMYLTWVEVLQEIEEDVVISLLTQSLTQKNLSRLLDRLGYDKYTPEQVGLLCDKMKNLGNKYATLAGYSFDYSSLLEPETSEDQVNFLQEWWRLLQQYKQGFMLSEDYRYLALQKWNDRLISLSKRVTDSNGANSHMQVISSGTRGSITSLVSMQRERGLVSAHPSFMVPIGSSLAIGLTEIENSVASCRVAELVVKALGTREGGYFNRKMVEFLKDCTVTSRDCGTEKGYCLVLRRDKDRELLFGKTLLRDFNAEAISIAAGSLLSWELVNSMPLGSQVHVRTVLKCLNKVGVCASCYGSVIGDWGLPKMHDSVGLIAAHAMSEPITQMLMKTKHVRDLGLSGLEELVNFDSPYRGRVEVVQGKLIKTDQILMNIDPEEQVTLRVGDSLLELPYGALVHEEILGKEVKEGDRLYQMNGGVMLYSTLSGKVSVSGNLLEIKSADKNLSIYFDTHSFLMTNQGQVEVGDPLLSIRKYVRSTSEFKKLSYMLGKSSQLTYHVKADADYSTISSKKLGSFNLKSGSSNLSLTLLERVIFIRKGYRKGELVALGKDGRDVRTLTNVDQIIEDYHGRLQTLYDDNDIKVSPVHFELFIREFLTMCVTKRDGNLVSMNFAQGQGLDYTMVNRDIGKPYEYKKTPFARLSYENVLRYLIESALVGDEDKLDDFVSNFVVGNFTGEGRLNDLSLGNDDFEPSR